MGVKLKGEMKDLLPVPVGAVEMDFIDMCPGICLKFKSILVQRWSFDKFFFFFLI